MIHIIDYGMGNLRSVTKGFESQGIDCKICQSAHELEVADKLVLPGVGAFRDAIAHLKAQNFIEPIIRHIERDRPFLGICLGLQLLFDRSFEDGEFAGLGIIPGDVVRFEEQPGLKIPHMGWNQLMIEQADNPLLAEIPADAWFYFVHSYYVKPDQNDVVAARAEHGLKFTAMIGRGNLFAAQFHPEKSQQYGLQLLKNFSNL